MVVLDEPHPFAVAGRFSLFEEAYGAVLVVIDDAPAITVRSGEASVPGEFSEQKFTAVGWRLDMTKSSHTRCSSPAQKEQERSGQHDERRDLECVPQNIDQNHQLTRSGNEVP